MLLLNKRRFVLIQVENQRFRPSRNGLGLVGKAFSLIDQFGRVRQLGSGQLGLGRAEGGCLPEKSEEAWLFVEASSQGKACQLSVAREGVVAEVRETTQ